MVPRLISKGKTPGTGSPPYSDGGFSLLEVMVAVAIIAIALVAVYQLYAQSIRLSAAADFYSTASFLTRKLVGEIDGNLKNDPTDDSGDFGDDFPGYDYRITIEDVMSDAFEQEGAKMKKIDIEVSRNENEDVYHLRTYRHVQTQY